MDGLPLRLQHFRDQGSGGGLPVAAGDSVNRAGAESEKDLQLTGDYTSGLSGLRQLRAVKVHAGGPENDIKIGQAVQIFVPQAELDPQGGELLRQIPQLFPALPVA